MRPERLDVVILYNSRPYTILNILGAKQPLVRSTKVTFACQVRWSHYYNPADLKRVLCHHILTIEIGKLTLL